MAANAKSSSSKYPKSICKIPCDKPSPKPPTSAYDRMMTIQVVKNTDSNASNTEVTEDFVTYRGLLCHHSKYFKKLLTGHFKESGSMTYKMTTCTPEIFTLFYNWMNTGVAWMGDEDFLVEDGKRICFKLALDLYVFADFHEISALRNHAVEICFQQFHDNWIGLISIEEIYQKTPEKSPLRKLTADLLVDTCECSRIVAFLGHVTRADIFLDLITTSNEQGVILGVAPAMWASGPEQWKEWMEEHFCERYHDHRAAA